MVPGLNLFLRNSICLVINIVAFVVVCLGLYTASPATAPPFEIFQQSFDA
jgi:hypothetical protein